ncbi:hypothetical protein [Nocardia puris]|uniref:hypothetical protein n=1 Tax=Nocardia puris TaxID=208602 RepID=UPI001E46B927|nr:hypothetical protein [Nocardia puris]
MGTSTTAPASPPGDDQPSGLANTGALARLLATVRPRLIACGILSALSAAAGIVPYIAVAEIARVMLDNPTDAAATVWTWVGVGSAGAALWLLLFVQSSRLGHFADAAILHDLRARIVRPLGALPLWWFRAQGSGRSNAR